MADPVSIISLLGTAATVTEAVLKYVSAVRKAPKELETLSHELESLHQVLERLITLAESEDSSADSAEFSPLFDATAELIISLEDIQEKIEKRSTAKGLGKVYDRLTWPIDGPNIQKLLQTIQRDTQIFHFALTVNGTRKLSQLAKQGTEMLSTSQSVFHMQSEIQQALLALPEHTKLIAELERLHTCSDADQDHQGSVDQEFLRELSTLDFTAMQKSFYAKRYANTGQWLLESLEFQTWLKPEAGQHSVLWCQGDPGIGKTVLTSIVINHVTENTGRGRTAKVYIYCNYANAKTFSVENLLCSMVRQLVEQTTHAATIAELRAFLGDVAKNRNMTEEDASSWIEVLSKNFDVVYTFVDALDECPEPGRESLLLRLKQYSMGAMRVFLTSRFNVDVTVQIPHAVRARIGAIDNDISAYVESNVHKHRRLASFISRDPELKRHIIQTICRQACGMFLLARLQIEGLSHQTSPKTVRSALENLPANFFTIYDQTIGRICDLPNGNSELGLKVLSIVFTAVRPLKINELRHALAVESGDNGLDPDALTDIDILLNVTAGLVVIDLDPEHGKRVLRLVHHTLKEYFEINQERVFPDSKFILARACLSDCTDDFCFVFYASRHWAHHLRAVQTELMDQSLAFVQDTTKVSAWVDAQWYWILRALDDHLDPVFLAAHFHLSDLFTRLVSSRDINTQSRQGETPLIRAVAVIPSEKGVECEPPCLDFEDERTWRRGGEPPSIRALDMEQCSMVEVILDHNADIEAKDPLGKTAAFYAVETNNVGMLNLLLDRGANIDARMKSGETLLHVAARRIGRTDVLQFLLNRSAYVNVWTKEREIPDYVATNRFNSAELDRSIDHVMHADVVDKQSVTHPQGATGHRPTLLIEQGSHVDTTDSAEKTFLDHEVPLKGLLVVDVESQAQRVNNVDIKGRTPLHHAYYESARPWVCEYLKQKTHNADVIRLLIEAGASVNIADVDGRVPKDYSKWCDLENEIEWIEAY